MAAENCKLDYYQFCMNQDPRILNMCPPIIGEHLKETCVVTLTQAKVIDKECASELKNICQVSKGDDFMSNYICLTNPEKWNEFKPSCLQSLVKGNSHH